MRRVQPAELANGLGALFASLEAPADLALPGITAAQLEEAMDALVSSPFLSGLDLGSCAAGVPCALFARLERSRCCLVRLHVARCALGDDGAVVLARALFSLPRLRTLDAGRNGLSALGAHAIFSALGRHLLSLRELVLDSNEDLFIARGPESSAAMAVEALGTALQHNRVLETLSLGSCGLEAEVAKRLAEWLPKWQLRTLRLRGNAKLEVGTCHLLRALGERSSLVELDVSGCGFGFVRQLSAVLGATVSYATVLEHFFKTNTTLRVLDVRGTPLQRDVLSTLDKYARKARGLVALHYSGHSQEALAKVKVARVTTSLGDAMAVGPTTAARALLWQQLQQGNAQGVATTIQEGADAYSRAPGGQTVLHMAVASGSVACLQLVLANPFVQPRILEADDAGLDALDLGAVIFCEIVVRFLIHYSGQLFHSAHRVRCKLPWRLCS